MNEQRRQNVIITGSGRLEGGAYETIKIAGSCRVDGDLDVNQIKIGGSLRVEGDLSAGEMKTAGSCRVAGDVEAELMKTAGTCTVTGNVRAKLFKNAGSQEVDGTLQAEEITSGGVLKVSGDVEADKFLSRGRFEIGGLLTADEVKIELGGGRVQEIGGERVEVRVTGPFWGWRDIAKVEIDAEQPFAQRRKRGVRITRLGHERDIDIKIDLGGLLEDVFEELEKVGHELGRMGGRVGHAFAGHIAGSLEADTIEGDEIFLENTRARVVRGTRVTIGAGCRIETVEYKDSLDVHPDAQVKRQTKL
jgi:cytoskeletal protein CcmA (bactofilin family)